MIEFRMANFEWRMRSCRICAFFGMFLIAIFLFGGSWNIRNNGGEYPRVGVALADEDGEGEEDEDDDDEDEDESEDREKRKETIPVTRYEVRQVARVVTVLAPEYGRDTDGDLLVDGIDPNPLIHQKEYFTDADDDGIPNVFDRFSGEDDFSYFEEDDADQDGILDTYERLAER